jgi:DNA-binding CsgD family transcriptional regulator
MHSLSAVTAATGTAAQNPRFNPPPPSFVALGELSAQPLPQPLPAPRLLFEGLLDQLDTALLLCDEHGHVRWANAAARQELVAGRWLAERHGVLLSSASGGAKLLPALAAACQRSRRQVLGLGEGGQRLFVAVAPSASADGQPLALLLLGRRDPCSPLALELMGISHGLTPAERRVLAALVAGSAPSQIATEHGVRLSTVRTQVAALRAKLGVRGQAALLCAVGGLPPLAMALRAPAWAN